MVNIIEQLIIFGGGIFAGILGGLLGIGGGIVLMPILRFFVGLSPAVAAGTCILAVFFTTLGGSFRHYKLGHVKIRSILPVIIAGAIFTPLEIKPRCSAAGLGFIIIPAGFNAPLEFLTGFTLVFSLIFLYLAKKEKWLDLGVGLVFSFVSMRMIIEGSVDLLRKKIKEESRESEIQGPLLGKVIMGGMAGILPGLFGIGTGAILVPAFTLILKAPIKIAIGSSLTCFSVNAFFSALLKFFQGFVYLPVALPICLGTVIGSNIGAVLNKRFPSSVLKILFGIAFSYVSYQYSLVFFQGRS